MSKNLELIDLAKKLLDLASEELEYISSSIVEEDRLNAFVEEKKRIREGLSKLLPPKDILPREKAELKEILVETHKLEEKIGTCYKNKLNKLQINLGNLNKEKMVKEAYAKSGMDFGTDNLK